MTLIIRLNGYFEETDNSSFYFEIFSDEHNKRKKGLPKFPLDLSGYNETVYLIRYASESIDYSFEKQKHI